MTAVERQPEYIALVDWDDDGDFEDTYDDVSEHLLASEGITVAGLGRDQGRGLAPPQDSSLGLVLNNQSQRYSSENAGSAIHDGLLPGRPIRLQTRIGSDWTLNDPTVILNDPNVLLGGRATLTLFDGHVDEFKEDHQHVRKRVIVSAKGKLGKLERITAYTQLYTSISTGTAMGHLFTAAGMAASEYEIDSDVIANGRTLSYWYADGRTVAEQARELWATEGYSAFLGEIEPGVVSFLGRNYRTTATQSQEIQASYLDDGTELPYTGFRITPGYRDVLNAPYIEELVRRAAASSAAIWTYDQTVTLDGSGAASVTARLREPFTNAITPVVTTDFTLSSGVVTVALSRTSGIATEIQFSGGTPGATITSLQLRAQSYAEIGRVRVEPSISTAASVAKYGTRELALEVWPGLSVTAGVSLCDAVALAYMEARPIVEIDLVNRDGHSLYDQMTRRVGDRVYLEESGSGTAIDAIVEQLTHRITPAVHYLTLGCEKVVEADWALYDVDPYGTGLFGQ